MRELLRLFEEHGVQYALVGGHAVDFYGSVRTTQDMDLLRVKRSSDRPRDLADADELAKING